MMLCCGAKRCHYVTVYPESNEEAAKRSKHAKWARHGKAWKERKTFYQIHEVRPDQGAINRLIYNGLIIRRMVKGDEETQKERELAEQVRAEFVSWAGTTTGKGQEDGA